MAKGATNIEQLIHDHAEGMAEQMNKIAKWAESEEDVRYECNKLIDDFLKIAGIKVKGRHEYGLAGGRIDSKYGGVIIEYKDPRGTGKITEDANAPGTKAVVKQIKKRFKDFQAEEHVEKERIFGVGCDGDTLIFVRHRGKDFEVDDPQPTTRHTVERLLRALVSLGAQGYSFTPDHLSGHFGADSPLAQEGINSIYQVITETKSKKAQTFFNQWKILFGEVCGYDVEGKNEKIKKLADHYLVHKAQPAELLFSVHTYYAIFIKFLAAEITSSFSPMGVSVLKKCVNAPTPAKLKREMDNLEQGGIWSQLGITNFLEGDLFSWYLDAWDERISEVIRDIVTKLDEYDPTTLSVEPSESRDLLKKLYQHLFPKSVRHDLGEYYTPDWLAEHVLNELGYDGNPDKRLLDPACGSGTFLVMAINRIKLWFEEHRHECGYNENELIIKILNNVIGFDLNPLAVMAARTNYLLAIRELLKFSSEVELPVYLCDSIMTPAEVGSHDVQMSLLTETGVSFDSKNPPMAIKTAAGIFLVPAEIAISRELIGKYAELLEACIRNKYEAQEFIDRCCDEGIPVSEKHMHDELYKTLKLLDADNQNGIWARIIKNAFAPLFIDEVDFIVGNPPWVNWEYLPENYRLEMMDIWRRYNFFVHKGMKAVLPAGHLDLSALFTYVTIDSFCKDQGKLGFVITNTAFKSKGSGMGFRRFELPNGDKLGVVIVDDFSSLNVFEDASNYTSVIVLSKGQITKYPVPYRVWKTKSNILLQTTSSLEQVKNNMEINDFVARPFDCKDIMSAWSTGNPKLLKILEKMQGSQVYRARMGITSDGADGVYLIDELDHKGKNAIIRNRPDLSKRKPPKWEGAIESDLIYPVVRGRDISRWKATSNLSIIVPHPLNKPQIGIEEDIVRRKYPLIYAYFNNFEGELKRRGFLKKIGSGRPFYSMWKIGDYTFMPFKVAWKRMTDRLTAVVISSWNGRLLIPTDTITFVPFESEKEAHYFCATINSSISRYTITSSTATGRGFGSPSVLKTISIPKFRAEETIFHDLSKLSINCHKATAKGDLAKVYEIERDIDELSAKLWGITDNELKAIQEALQEKENGKGKRQKRN